jgi:hypothetical protein
MAVALRYSPHLSRCHSSPGLRPLPLDCKTYSSSQASYCLDLASEPPLRAACEQLKDGDRCQSRRPSWLPGTLLSHCGSSAPRPRACPWPQILQHTKDRLCRCSAHRRRVSEPARGLLRKDRSPFSHDAACYRGSFLLWQAVSILRSAGRLPCLAACSGHDRVKSGYEMGGIVNCKPT